MGEDNQNGMGGQCFFSCWGDFFLACGFCGCQDAAMKGIGQTTSEWLEDQQPEMERAVWRLMELIRKDAPRTELLEMVDYIGEFWQDTDPVQMGWVGSDGRP